MSEYVPALGIDVRALDDPLNPLRQRRLASLRERVPQRRQEDCDCGQALLAIDDEEVLAVLAEVQDHRSDEVAYLSRGDDVSLKILDVASVPGVRPLEARDLVEGRLEDLLDFACRMVLIFTSGFHQ